MGEKRMSEKTAYQVQFKDAKKKEEVQSTVNTLARLNSVTADEMLYLLLEEHIKKVIAIKEGL